MLMTANRHHANTQTTANQSDRAKLGATYSAAKQYSVIKAGQHLAASLSFIVLIAEIIN